MSCKPFLALILRLSPSSNIWESAMFNLLVPVTDKSPPKVIGSILFSRVLTTTSFVKSYVPPASVGVVSPTLVF